MNEGSAESRGRQHVDLSRLVAFLSYGLLPIVAILIVYIILRPNSVVAGLCLIVTATALAGFTVLRQALTAKDVQGHLRRLDQLHRDAADASDKLQQTNDALARAMAQLERRNRQLSVLNDRLQQCATVDLLTGLLNHAASAAALQIEVDRAVRRGRATSILLLDLDHFAWINNELGYTAGDLVVREVATVVQGALRSTDVLGRWGGEEFLAILPETEAESARLVAERIRTAIAHHVYTADGPAASHLTCSIGAASYPDDAPDPGALLEAARRSVMTAKKLGRNQLRLFGEEAVGGVTSQDGITFDDSILVSTVEALAAVVEIRDQYTGDHTDAVSALAVRLGLALGMDTARARMVGLAARLRDIGKIAIPDALLQKPARLSDDEWNIMRTHPEVGAEVVRRVPPLRDLGPAIRGHHERWDGRGYPDGLTAENIPLPARIVAVADAYLAMTTERAYRSASSSAEAVAELHRCAGSQFDPAVVTALDELLASMPSLAAGHAERES